MPSLQIHPQETQILNRELLALEAETRASAYPQIQVHLEALEAVLEGLEGTRPLRQELDRLLFEAQLHLLRKPQIDGFLARVRQALLGSA